MALFKISKGTKVGLNAKAKVEGYCWYTTDDSMFYIDINGTTRQPLNARYLDPEFSYGTNQKPVYINKGVPTQCNDTLAVSITGHAESATSADTASKLGNTTAIGGTSQPVYFSNKGVPVALSDTKGSASIPIYMDAGTITACTPSSLFSVLSWTAGTTSGPILNATIAGYGRTATIPSASATASGVITTGAQTFAGAKTFSEGIIGNLTGTADVATQVEKSLKINNKTYNGSTEIDVGTIGIGHGGTGTATAPTQGGIIYGVSTSAYGCIAAGTTGQVLMSAGTGAPTWHTPKSDNTASTIVIRDASGNFSAGTITASLSGHATSATSADQLTTARNINGTSFNGTADITTAKWGTARTISISDTAGTTGTSIDGSANANLTIPSTLKGFSSITSTTFVGALNGHATSATSADTATSATTATTATKATQDGNGNTITSTYLPLSGGIMNGVITGKTQLASARMKGSASGYHQIFINSANAWMTAFTIRVYQAYKWSDIVISGYNYGASYWYNPSAILMGSSTNSSITVSFGYTSSYNLWVAIPADIYYGVEIIDCVNGYDPFDSWKDLFTISNVSTLSGTVQTTVTATRPWYRGESVTGAVWNDYAEYRESDCEDFGYVLMEKGDDTLTKTNERLSHFAGISSDTWGFSQGETEKAKTPIAVAGRVLVYPYEDRYSYNPGDVVCAAPGGTVSKMTREEIITYPDRIVGIVSCIPDYDQWGGGEEADRNPVKVNGRIWIKVK